jgi:Carboxypeptidase regulatory-like domain
VYVKVLNVVRIAVCVALLTTVAFSASPDDLLTKAGELFGPSLNPDHHIFQLNDAFALWLISDSNGDLLEVVVGAKSHYRSEFPNAKRVSIPESLSEDEYRDALQKISELKDIGPIKEWRGAAIADGSDLLNTDHFENAFVDRIVSGRSEDVYRFDVYFLHSIESSPVRAVNIDGYPMVCLGSEWYYLAEDTTERIQRGKWQALRVAGPSYHRTAPCFRTTVLYDADGFTIENPANETIELADARVRSISGRVVDFSGQPVNDANVEIRSVAGDKVLRRKTRESGKFAFSGIPDGKYKFKVTKDGFKSLSGFLILDRKARAQRTTFTLPVGT